MATRRLAPFLLPFAASLVLAAALPAAAERLPSRADDPAVSRAADLARIGDAIARGEVARALAENGLSAGQVQERLARLSDEDVRRLAANLDQVQAAGQVPNYIWILLGIFLAVSILVMIF